MGEDKGQSGTAVERGSSDPAQLQREIEQTREEIGETVESLAAKTDVKGRAQARVAEGKERLAQRKDDVVGKAKAATPESASAGAGQAVTAVRSKPVPAAGAAAFAGGLLIGYLLGRRS
jgi:ElaB/YqjD/DUF883 family membrane-anchored ribosome-binding protein